MNNPVYIYTKTGCKRTKEVCDLFDKHKIKYTKGNIDNIFIDKEWVGYKVQAAMWGPVIDSPWYRDRL